MNRTMIFSFAFIFSLVILPVTTVNAAEEASKVEAKSELSLETLPDNQEDPDVMIKVLQAVVNEIQELTFHEPESATVKLDELKSGLKNLKPMNVKSKKILASANRVTTYLQKMIVKSGTSIEDQKKAFEKTPSNKKLLTDLATKMGAEVVWYSRKDIKKATALLKENKEYFAGITKELDDKDAAAIKKFTESHFTSLERALSGKSALSELIGKQAAPLSVSKWVNGSKLTDKDLEGKVVVLDFWAVWCGPCRMMFPALRDWHDKYDEEKLVIIGVTSYYNYEWDEEKKTQVRGKGKVSEADELSMLKKFADEHKLLHRFAIQDGRAMSSFYGVRGIPQLVVIDKKGKIRKITSGFSPASVKQVDALLKELVAE